MVEWIKLVVAGVLVAAGVAACHNRDMSLIQQGVDEQVARENGQKEKDRLANLKKEADHAKAVKALDEQRVKEKQEYETNLAKLQHDVRTGAERLRIATLRKPDPVSPGATPSRAEPEEGSVLVPEAAADVLGVAGGIGQTVRDYNSLLDAYHSLEKECTK